MYHTIEETTALSNFQAVRCSILFWLTSVLVLAEFLFWTFLRQFPFYGSGVNELIRAFMVYKRADALRNRLRHGVCMTHGSRWVCFFAIHGFNNNRFARMIY